MSGSGHCPAPYPEPHGVQDKSCTLCGARRGAGPSPPLEGEGNCYVPLPKGREIATFLPLQRLCRNRENSEKRHAELVSASNGINKLRDPETSSG